MPGHNPHIKRRLTETRRRAHAAAVATPAVAPPVGEAATIRSVTINRTGFRAWFIGIFLLSLFGLVGFEASEPSTANSAGIIDYMQLAINATVNPLPPQVCLALPTYSFDGRLDDVDPFASPSVGWLSDGAVPIAPLQPPIPAIVSAGEPHDVDNPKAPRGTASREVAPVASPVPADWKQDVTDAILSVGKLGIDPLGKTTSATTSRGPEAPTETEWSFLTAMNGRWKGLAVGPFRGYLGIVGIVKTNPEPAALADEGSPTAKTFELRLQEMRLRYEEEVARLRRRQARQMKEQRLNVRTEERLRRRPKQLADRLARQATHEFAVKMHVKIMWNQYRSRVNGMTDLVVYRPMAFGLPQPCHHASPEDAFEMLLCLCLALGILFRHIAEQEDAVSPEAPTEPPDPPFVNKSPQSDAAPDTTGRPSYCSHSTQTDATPQPDPSSMQDAACRTEPQDPLKHAILLDERTQSDHICHCRLSSAAPDSSGRPDVSHRSTQTDDPADCNKSSMPNAACQTDASSEPVQALRSDKKTQTECDLQTVEETESSGPKVGYCDRQTQASDNEDHSDEGDQSGNQDEEPPVKWGHVWDVRPRDGPLPIPSLPPVGTGQVRQRHRGQHGRYRKERNDTRYFFLPYGEWVGRGRRRHSISDTGFLRAQHRIVEEDVVADLRGTIAVAPF